MTYRGHVAELPAVLRSVLGVAQAGQSPRLSAGILGTRLGPVHVVPTHESSDGNEYALTVEYRNSGGATVGNRALTAHMTGCRIELVLNGMSTAATARGMGLAAASQQHLFRTAKEHQVAAVRGTCSEDGRWRWATDYIWNRSPEGLSLTLRDLSKTLYGPRLARELGREWLPASRSLASYINRKAALPLLRSSEDGLEPIWTRDTNDGIEARYRCGLAVLLRLTPADIAGFDEVALSPVMREVADDLGLRNSPNLTFGRLLLARGGSWSGARYFDAGTRRAESRRAVAQLLRPGLLSDRL